MDLHVIGPLASPAERAAVDAVLGPPESGWVGGVRNPAVDGHAAHGGHAARSRRSQLLPALHAVQSRIGWISQPALNYVCRRLTVAPAEAYGVATFYSLFSTQPRPPIVAHVCDDIACRLAGAESICADVERTLGPAGAPVGDGRATWLRSPCLGLCDRAPAAMVTVAGDEPRVFAAAPVDAAGVIARLEPSTGPLPSGSPPGSRPTEIVAGDAPRTPTRRRLLARVGVVDPGSLDDYRAHGGYLALARALDIGPAAVVAEVTASRLVGRGGAAFPTGRKWAAVAAQPTLPHYLVCNADESEPGTFKDRVLMEGDPFSVVEAMTITAFATGCELGYLYIRGEYPDAERRIATAIAAARDAGLLGANVAGSGFAFDIELRRGAGAYICGEETALFESIEGKRGEPRNKPPFPVEVGLFGKPTVVNNVETLVNVPLIVLEGGAAFATIGTEGSTGPKLFCLSGHVARPGVYEVEFGATLRDLIELAGGVPGGQAIRTILLGGAAGVFVGPDALDTPLTFEDTRAIGATLGSGVVMVFDETADLIGTLRRIAQFFRDESCGQCVPCRIGSVRQEELLARLAAGSMVRPREEELGLLRENGQAMRDASICGLGQTASSAIESALRQPGMVAL
ncbi:MAG TPA: NAD(P)H-dependent oxidoreductase subunit E [Candidatus Limnocylindrales bacterium]|nr:NAD(P)H-dependent oxidoreductase subunit E [Candidatus Limnocylindrales bacterium]